MLEGMSAKRFVSLLIELNITTKQFMLLYFLYLDKQEGQGRLIKDGPQIANIYRYAEKVETWSFDEIDDLIVKGYLVDRNPLGSGGIRQTYPDHFEVTKELEDRFFASEDSFEEFWEEYPSFVDNFDNPRGPKIPLKASMYEEVEILYKKRVRTKWKHAKVMETVRWAKQNGLINMSISKYVGSLMWDQHEKLRLEGSSGTLEHRTI